MFKLSNSNENLLNKWKKATKYEDNSLGILLQVIEKAISKHQELNETLSRMLISYHFY